MTPQGWWQRRSLRLRVTAAAATVLAVGLILGAIVLAAVFQHRRISVIDTTVRAEASVVGQLVASGSLPAPLPAPAAANTLAQVIDPAGTVLAATASASRVVDLLSVEQLNRHFDHPFTSSSTTLGPASVRILARHATLQSVPVTIVTAVPLTDVTSTLSALRNVLLVVVPLVVLAAAVATWLAVSAALQPVERLRAAADAVGVQATRRPPQLPVPPGSDELRRLGETLNDMLHRLYAARERQRAFIADAAHELRSPIASLRTQLEVALAVPPAPQEWQQEWQSIVAGALSDVTRLGKLADDLLLLARLDSGAAGYRNEPVDIADLVDGERIGGERVRGELIGGETIDDATGRLVVAGDEAALRRLLANLTANAQRHARTQVKVAAHRDGDHVVVTVDDDGPGIPSQDRERVFERWVRLDSARGRDDGGAGLGLAIARSIARAHGGDVRLDASPLGGLRATVRLPAASRTRTVLPAQP